jgi:tRNA (guanosine-2'-O-)-methyltransferase
MLVLTEKRKARIREVAARRQKDLTLVLANIHDPHNVSAILRSCDAFGVGRVHLYYTVEAFPALGHKSSASARKWVETVRHGKPGSLCVPLADQGYQILAAGLSEKARPLTAFDYTGPTAIILGNEHRGVDEEFAPYVHGEVFIPMQGMVQSLNVSVAAAVFLFEAFRQRYAKGLYDEPSLPPQELEALVERMEKK